MSTEPQATPQPAEHGTRYVVLQKHAAPGGWEVLNERVWAASSDAAVRQSLTANDNKEGEYVAVPARSWKPTKVTVVQETKVRLG